MTQSDQTSQLRAEIDKTVNLLRERLQSTKEELANTQEKQAEIAQETLRILETGRYTTNNINIKPFQQHFSPT